MIALPDKERWSRMSRLEQLANICSEVGRTAKWVAKCKPQMSEGAFLRALDLFDLTISCNTTAPGLLKEICRSRDLFCEAYLSSDTESLNYLDKYFSRFATALRRRV